MRIVDYGNCPQHYVSGLARIDNMGATARFCFYDLRPPRPGEETPEGGMVAEVTRSLVAPCDAVHATVEMMITTFGVTKTWPWLIRTAPTVKTRM